MSTEKEAPLPGGAEVAMPEDGAWNPVDHVNTKSLYGWPPLVRRDTQHYLASRIPPLPRPDGEVGWTERAEGIRQRVLSEVR